MAVQTQFITPEEYLTRERAADFKSEYFNGEIFAMSGGTPDHSAIAVNISSELNRQLKNRPCRVFSSDMRISTGAHGLFTYPDVSVVCGDLAYYDERRDVLTNSIVIVEVLSDSTEVYDRGRKFFLFWQIESLTDYLLVSQHEACVEHYSRQAEDRWVLTTAVGRDSNVYIASIDCTLSLAEVYDKIEFSGVSNA